MNLNLESAQTLVQKVQKSINFNNKLVKVIICPQFLLIPKIKKFFKHNSSLALGAQDVHQSISGPFTGDTSIELLKAYKCKYIIIGHSERRLNHFETDSLIKKKIEIVQNYKINPILCVGESILERKNKKYLDVIKRQILMAVPERTTKITIAYEPIWSIGSGLIPKLDEIEEIASFIRNLIKNKKPKIKNLNVIYGGSINSENFFDINNLVSVNGGLIGGASLKIKELSKMIRKAYLD